MAKDRRLEARTCGKARPQVAQRRFDRGRDSERVGPRELVDLNVQRGPTVVERSADPWLAGAHDVGHVANTYREAIARGDHRIRDRRYRAVQRESGGRLYIEPGRRRLREARSRWSLSALNAAK